ncbi:hypothetical protein KEM52_002580, partial [Ascosphaera acerosa]
GRSRHPPPARAHHRHRRRPPPHQQVAGVAGRERRAPAGPQGAPDPLPPQGGPVQEARQHRRRDRRRHAARQDRRRCFPHRRSGRRCVRHPQVRDARGPREDGLPHIARRALRGAPRRRAREARQGQGGRGRGREEI